MVLGKRWDSIMSLDAAVFLKAVAETMPYLDGGSLFDGAARRIRWKPNPRELSTPLSVALRDLHEEGRIQLKMYGDTRDAFTLSQDQTSTIKAVRTVTIYSQGGGE